MSVGLALSAIFAYYVCALHESQLWFSSIREVEREISMRTESGLYYSYFKEFFPPTERHRPILEVIDHLMHDKITEFPREINTLQRFNIFQEVGIALLYRGLQQLNVLPLPQPIIFYVYTCFFFAGIGLLGLYCLAWKLGHHWTFGLLAASWMFAHIDHSTRAFFAVNLRENFAIPIFTIQTFFILCYLTPQPKNASKANKFLNIVYLECIFVGEMPFESAIYVCHGAFSFIGYDFFLQTQNSGLLLLYLIALLLVGIGAIRYFYSKKSIKICHDFQTPQAIFLTVQSVLCGALAILTMRLKYLWFPQMAALAAYAPIVLDRYIGRWARIAIVIAVSCILLYSQYNEYQKQMNNEQEFYDPDTVDLMEWINTLPDGTVFTGSMQLLAGVKACTGRPITNHPHFEDKWLRQRTERLYQIYGRRSVDDVYKILKSESTTHIILEDSICLHHSDGCSINDLVDLSNRHSTDSNSTRFSTKLLPSPIERFFFENRTFRVYQLL
ncbi:q-cell neuroblast polarization domain-containing protein [Ditylenchus destructor]|nr:q-cell neuroblast polarization domain-containing protein [Ditylenchus destructor]